MPTDRNRRTGTAVSLLLVALAALTAGCSEGEPDAQASQRTTISAADETTTPTASPDATPGKETSATSATSSTPSSTPEQSPSSTESPAATPSSGASSTKAETAPPVEGTPTPTGLPGLSPAPPDPPLVAFPLPADAAAEGRLVSGFPSFLRPPAGASVATSSVTAQSETERLQVALGGSTTAMPDQVLGTYRTRLTARGMDEQDAPAVAGSAAATFVRGSSTITVTVSREGDRTNYSVYGALQARKE